MSARGWIGATAIATLALGACDAGSSEVYLERFQGTLAVDVRDAVDVTIAVRPDKTLDVRLAMQGRTFDLVREGTLTAKGQLESFPEAAMDLYVATWSYPMPAVGPCRGQPVSLALSLQRRHKNDRVAGSLTAYCGADTWRGAPARLLRLSGELRAY
jgi:hypothetical protein